MSVRAKALSFPADKQSIRIAQISDPHLFADKGAEFLGLNPWDSFSAVLSELRYEPLDMVIASGDLSQDHSIEAYRHFADGVRGLGVPISALPGNHDAFDRMELGLEGSGVILDRRIILGRWQLLQLDSTVLGLPGGHLNHHRLEWLEAVLHHSSAYHTLIALHHHPLDTGCTWLDQHRLDNGAEFNALISGFDTVKGVIWGHVHQEMDERLDHIRMLAAPSTSIQFRPQCRDFTLDNLQPGYRLLTLNADGSIDTSINRLSGDRFQPDRTASGY
ncbi:3',5'-cyclic-AMP phosphodiesterase [Ferrimonas sediminicola]|uniref:3',5'-cyclic-AMP phosphodiesterase n=1 Tax=Ferrimonas sediminicola TaxID=2569538 RepID=A0A4U1BJP7_9GAMM|nr:3',5'-cyclic-AMP phosphodiesterase [Ferrimonas sediminicola]TKB51412.1 3',5'-cyclic-AMP phosphodiesterase [Ferrimonas sediminicola]